MIWIQCYCWFYELLTPSKKTLFLKLLDEFISEVKFVGIEIEITDEIKIAVGGWAVLLILNRPLGLHWYKNIERVSIYKGSTLKSGNALGQLANGFHYCQVHLAWKDVKDSATKASDDNNTIIHEFAHVLDQINRDLNANLSGLLTKEESDEWDKVFCHDYLHSKPDKLRTKLWKYFGLGAWNEYDPDDPSCVDLAELFAVSSEKYYETPFKLNEMAPDIYNCLLTLYRFNPLEEIPKK